MSDRVFRAACVQLNAGQDMAANIETASALIRRAHSEGARFIALPENAVLMEHRREVALPQAVAIERHPAVLAFSALARELGTSILVGSIAVPASGNRSFNRSVLLAEDGRIAAHYDKIHLFDVDIPDGATYRESSTIAPGDEAVVATTPFATLGLTVCYDLRFAYLYRELAQRGAEVLTVPAAFTQLTGEAHWHVLVRARAIETGSFVIAPAQCGSHSGNRRTFGHSLMVAPWGEVLADGGSEPGIVLADIDLARVTEARARIPALKHDRSIAVPTPSTAPAERKRGVV
ncbi:MAG: carbon-nitrogen hydrolase family protein [Alphaproteobacteria bacterium]|nr:carbon-nitrogen hydrolase family protein [Alphaproteobacteria bacterium]